MWKRIGMFSTKYSILNFQEICDSCAKASRLDRDYLEVLAPEYISEMIRIQNELQPKFTCTTNRNRYIQGDENNKLIKMNGRVYRSSNILSYELIEDNNSIIKGGKGLALAGGLLFGVAGAVVGGIVGNRSTSNVVSSLKIVVTFKDIPIATDVVWFYNNDSQPKNEYYYATLKIANESLNTIDRIVNKGKVDNRLESKAEESRQVAFSAANEILKFKNLLDTGIITQEEFERKKQQLLN